MRCIKKEGDGGYHLTQAHRSPPETAASAKSRWKSFQYKQEISDRLRDEQYGLCAYSEIRPDQVDLNTHIEHIQPKSRFPLRTFDYQNLVLCALSSEDLERRSRDDIFGGHAKLNDYEPSLFISCLDNDCARYFVYLSDGRVEAQHHLSEAEREKAHYTIDLLKLNCPYLVNQRKRWLDELSLYIDEHLESDDNLHQLAYLDLIPSNQKLSPFFSATRQLYGNIAEQVLADAAPELIG